MQYVQYAQIIRFVNSSERKKNNHNKYVGHIVSTCWQNSAMNANHSEYLFV